MVNLLSEGAKEIASAEGTQELPSAQIETMSESFPGMLAIHKGKRREGLPSCYNHIRDIVRSIGPEHNGHATLNTHSKHVQLLRGDAAARFRSMRWDNDRNARGLQAVYANAGPALYVSIKPGDGGMLYQIDALVEMNKNKENHLLSDIKAGCQNILPLGQEGFKCVFWHLIMAPYRALCNTSNQVEGLATAKEIHDLCQELSEQPRTVKDLPYFSTTKGAQLVKFAATFTGHDAYVQEMVRFCIDPRPEMDVDRLPAYYE
eukprot:SAG11_NODE_2298_length_3552_cov_11.614538_3_plen_261_part_00